MEGLETRKSVSVRFPGNVIQSIPMSIVNIPWPGRNSMTIPATIRNTPMIFRIIKDTAFNGVICIDGAVFIIMTK